MIIKKRRQDGVVQRYHVNPSPKWHHGEHNTKLRFRMIPVDDIEVTEYDQSKDKVESIKSSGDIQRPIRVHGKYEPGQKYQLFNGHHRFMAAKARGDKYIPAIVFLNPKAHKSWRERKVITIESATEKARRLRGGYTQLLSVDANKLQSIWERDQEGPLAWNMERMASARQRKVYDSYAKVTWNPDRNKIDIEDGRHRIAAAAERHDRIIIAVKPGFPEDRFT